MCLRYWKENSFFQLVNPQRMEKEKEVREQVWIPELTRSCTWEAAWPQLWSGNLVSEHQSPGTLDLCPSAWLANRKWSPQHWPAPFLMDHVRQADRCYFHSLHSRSKTIISASRHGRKQKRCLCKRWSRLRNIESLQALWAPQRE